MLRQLILIDLNTFIKFFDGVLELLHHKKLITFLFNVDQDFINFIQLFFFFFILIFYIILFLRFFWFCLFIQFFLVSIVFSLNFLYFWIINVLAWWIIFRSWILFNKLLAALNRLLCQPMSWLYLAYFSKIINRIVIPLILFESMTSPQVSL